jgi:hypothetical protein
MGSSVEDDNERIPTYEESIGQPRSSIQTTSSNEQPLEARNTTTSLTESLTKVRTQRINAIIRDYIDPLLQDQVLAGLHEATIALVPSNSHRIQTSAGAHNDLIEGLGETISHNNDESVLGFPDDAYVKLVRLHGEEYTIEFWRQPAVVRELELALRSMLSASGHNIFGSPPSNVQAEKPVRESRSMPPIAKMGLFRKKTKKAAAEQEGSSSASELRLHDQSAPSMRPGQVKIDIELQDVTLRVVTEMGLYDTKTGTALLVKMKIAS